MGLYLETSCFWGRIVLKKIVFVGIPIFYLSYKVGLMRLGKLYQRKKRLEELLR
jgi:hypothetical protein